LLFLVFGVVLYIKHNRFVAKCVEVKAVIVDVVDKVHISHNIFGQVEEKRTIKTPIVQYKYNQLYQFQSEVDARNHSLDVGDKVTVLLNPLVPKAARLDVGLTENTMLFKLMIGLGGFLFGLGVYLFNPNDFNLSIFKDLFSAAIIIFIVIYAYIKLSPLLSFLQFMPIYHENAKEVTDSVD